ncbi:hypothetical protein EJB05_11265, partial [Eragrostis curvula]
MASHSRAVACPSSFSSLKSNTIDQEQPHLSAACIRSLVKHLSSSSSAARSKAQHLHTMSSATSHDQLQQQQGNEQAPPKPQNKKQARRRMHTSKPYQERLLNMAEARREIVTALRIHRANMRQQSKYHHQEQQQPRLQQPGQVVFQEQSQAFEGVPVAMSYASSFSNNYLCNSPFAHLVDGSPAGNYSSSMLSYGLKPLEEAPAAVGGLDQLACNLPEQPLGLNLSFQGFGGSLENGKNSDDPFGVPLIQSLSCPASSHSAYSSPAMGGHGSLARRATEEYPSSADAQTAFSPVLDGDVCPIGDRERQGMEWSEAAANVAAASAWWTKIFESMGSGGGESAWPPQTTGAEVGIVDDTVAAADLLPEWQWLCDGVGVEEQEVTGPNKPDIMEMHVVNDGEYNCCYEGGHKDNGGDIALPCVDTGDMEGWDDWEWFS